MAEPLTARFLSSREIAPDVRHFVFEAVGLERLDFVPGQFVSLTAMLPGADGQERKITRAYSLASPPSGDNRFELCLNRVPGGHMSPHLFSMLPGDTIEMRHPLGGFVLREPPADSIFIATGTGVAPFRAMLQAHLKKGSPRFTLLLGSRYEDNLLYPEEFEEMAQRHPHFTFVPTLTRPGPNWKGRTGRVQKHLTEVIDGRTATSDLAVNFYLCGMHEMVEELRSILKDAGYDRKKIRTEKYD